MNNTKQSHDLFFKKTMSNLKVAREFFELYLPAHVLEMIDLNTLKPQKESYLDNTLGVGLVDMLFTVEFNNETGYLYTLVEHQSTADYWMAFRLCKYMLRIMDDHMKKHSDSKHLPLVYPLVFYSGTGRYNAPLDLWSLFIDSKLAKSFFTEPFRLVELRGTDDTQLVKKAWAGTMQFIMKHIVERDILPFLEQIKPVLEEIGKESFGYIEAILWYTLEKAESTKAERVLELFKEVVNKEKRSKVMSIADTIRAEGVQEGIQQIAINMLKEGQAIEFVAKVTGMSIDEISKLYSSPSDR